MNIPVLVSFLLVMLLLMSVMLPLQIKFGAEKSRIVVLGVIGGVAVLGFLLSKVFELKSMDETIKMLDAVPESIFVTEVVLFVAAVMVISYFSSLRIMKNKEL